MFHRKTLAFCIGFGAALWATPAMVHPHVFAEAKLKITVGEDGTVKNLSHTWRFDDVFSDTVLFEFDKDQDGKINATEEADISKTITDSTGDYNYFEAVDDNGKEVKMARPANLRGTFDGKILVVTFDNAPAEPMIVKGKVSFGIYDPTFYTSIDFVDDSDLSIIGLKPSCKTAVIRPDGDEAIAANQSKLTDAFFSDPQGTDVSKIFATRMEITCNP
jgi:ABC-type uncharacterized transport system substrate-binding protein